MTSTTLPPLMSRAEKRIEPVQPLDAASIKAVAPEQPKTHNKDSRRHIKHKLYGLSIPNE